MKNFIEDRKEFVNPVLASLLAVFLLYVLVSLISPSLISSADPQGGLLGMAHITEGADKGSFLWNFIYTFTDISNGPFFTDFFVAVMMFIGGYAARKLEKMKVPLAGTGTEGSGKRFIWLVAVQICAMCLANIIWRIIFGIHGSIPTFATAFSVAPIAVLYYGKPDLKKAITGVVLGAVLPVGAVYYLLQYFSTPLGLPGFAAVGTGMSLSTVLATELFNFLPWMKVNPEPERDDTIVVVNNKRKSAAWLTLIRVFGGDISELFFWGANLAGVGIIIGCFITWVINPYANANGLDLMNMLLCFMFTSCLSVFVWGPKLKKDGFAFTFEPLIVVGSLYPFCSNPLILLAVIVIAVFVAPFVIHTVIATPLFKRYHACVTVQLMAALMVIAGGVILRLF